MAGRCRYAQAACITIWQVSVNRLRRSVRDRPKATHFPPGSATAIAIVSAWDIQAYKSYVVLSAEVTALAWKAQSAGCISGTGDSWPRGKSKHQTVTAVGRELLGFIWSIGVHVEQDVKPTPFSCLSLRDRGAQSLTRFPYGWTERALSCRIPARRRELGNGRDGAKRGGQTY